jgi:hypothetical protein
MRFWFVRIVVLDFVYATIQRETSLKPCCNSIKPKNLPTRQSIRNLQHYACSASMQVVLIRLFYDEASRRCLRDAKRYPRYKLGKIPGLK